MYNGLGMNAGSLSRFSNAKTRSISAENFTGESGGGAKAIPSDDKYTGSGAAKELGLGWKVSPSVLIQPGVVFTIADIEGPGAIQSIWCAGDLNYDLIIRIYWDGQENPSVEALSLIHIYRSKDSMGRKRGQCDQWRIYNNNV